MPSIDGVNEDTPLIRGDQSDRHNQTNGQSHRRNEIKEGPRWKTYPAYAARNTWAVLAHSKMHIFLIFVPLGIMADKLHWDPTAVFVLNFIAIVPLASVLSFATEEITEHVGAALGGLLNATFGNAVELIVSIVALQQKQIRIVQASMLGSVLSNILLVLGCCFVAGGIKHHECDFNQTAAQTMSSLMAVSCASLIIPATLYGALRKSSESETDKNILLLSHGTAIILLILYVLYLWFQFKTHADLFDDEENQNKNRDRVENQSENQSLNEDQDRDQSQSQNQSQNQSQTLSQAPTKAPAAAEAESDDVQPGETLSTIEAVIWLLITTVFVAFCADYLVDSIDATVEKSHLSKTFIGLILLPIVGNAAEHVTAVLVAYKGKMDLAINVAIGSSMQIALFVTPFLVILGWIMNRAMTLHFQGFETIVFFISVLIVNYLIQDGKSNYLEGYMCLGIYAVIALAFFVYPDDSTGNLDPNFLDRFFSSS